MISLKRIIVLVIIFYILILTNFKYIEQRSIGWNEYVNKTDIQFAFIIDDQDDKLTTKSNQNQKEENEF